ncbi:18550_t:CDS:2, partial [Entrophospora sp. SA101]
VISPRLNRKPILIFLESAQHRKVEADTAYQSVIDYRHNLLWVSRYRGMVNSMTKVDKFKCNNAVDCICTIELFFNETH